jgi:hypothetical protein
MMFRAIVEPPEPMRGLEIPAEIVAALEGGKRPPVTVTINAHSWKTRVAIMRGRHLIGLSHANRMAAGVEIGEVIDVEIDLDTTPRVAVVPADLTKALDDDLIAKVTFAGLTENQRREYVRGIEAAKKPETRARRIEKLVAMLRDNAKSRRSTP